MDREIDIVGLTREDLECEFKYVQEKCKQLLEASERDAQRIHELKRNLETANAAEQYLAQELEQLTASAGNATTDLSNSKLQSENEEIRRKNKSLEVELHTMQEDYDVLVAEHTKLRCKIQEISNKNENMDTQGDCDKLVERLQVLEQDNMEILHKLEEQNAEAVMQSMLLAEKEKIIELVQEELKCLQENFRYKREELEEKTNLLESTQEQLCEANAKINMLMSAPENKDRKGNSLFAEVDDQRQVMIKLLAAQKKSYNEMKKIYNESQYEIRRLQRENSAMHTELQACSSIFRNADRTYREKLTGRIRYLVNEKEDLEKKLRRTQEYLKDLASNQGVPWLNSMLEFCKKETSELKTQLYSVRLETATLEEQVRNLQQDLARWRFESLKSRCLLADRENILNEHKIEFKPQNCVEYNISEEQIQKSRPRIVAVETTKPKETKESAQISFKEEPNITTSGITDSLVEQSLNSTSKSVISINDSIINSDQQNECSSIEVSPISTSQNRPLDIKSNSNQPLPCVTQLQIKSLESLNKEFQQGKLPESLPSILCKERNFLNENEKKVQFAANEATVHNISTTSNVSDIEVKCNNSMDTEKTVKEENCNSASATVKTVRTKSNVLVRRIVVKSKPK